MKKSLIILLTYHFSLLTALARPSLHDLNIKVLLQRDGSAVVTETRQMSVDGEGTEVYIVLSNLNGSKVSDLQVSDEAGTPYEYVGAWDVDRSRGWKTNRCGIITKRDGYELCWGLGESGSRTYTTRYTVSQLVDGYTDADGLLWMFVNPGLSPSPQHVKVTLMPQTEGPLALPDSIRFTENDTNIWGFRFRGEINFEDGAIVAESSEPFTTQSALIVMAQFQKGLFEPEAQNASTFDEVREHAFEGSDYTSDDEMTTEDWFFLVLFVLGVFVLPIVLGVAYFVYVWRARKKATKDLLWYRDIPMQGNLQRANDMLNAYKYWGADYNNLLSACILKPIDMGAISINKRMDEGGKWKEDFEIHELPDYGQQPLLLRKVHQIFQKAAGSDSILEPKELKQFMRSSYNQTMTDSFIQTLHTKTSIYQYKDRLDEVRQLFGLKKFLKEFTLLDERGIKEVGLWKDYIIYATLFGIADQVIRDMKKLNPEFFKMDRIADQMADDMTLPMIYSTMHRGTARAAMSKAEREARASGRGGRVSWGGGGGFSGGGFGGGVR